MSRRRRAPLLAALCCASLLFVMPIRADAYIDLGLAGQVFQAFYLIFIAAIAFLVSPILFFWKRIASWCKIGVGRDRRMGGDAVDEPRDTQQQDASHRAP